MLETEIEIYQSKDVDQKNLVKLNDQKNQLTNIGQNDLKDEPKEE